MNDYFFDDICYNKHNPKHIIMNRLLISAFCLLLTGNVFAQGVKFGFHIDPVLGWLKPDEKNISSTGVRIGFNYGLMLDFYFSENYAITTGVTIAQNGGKIKYDDADTLFPKTFPGTGFPASTEIKFNFQNLQIPFALKLKTNEIGYITYFGEVGVDNRFNIRTTGDIITPNAVDDRVDEKLAKDVRVFNLALHIGAGIEYSLSEKTAFVGGIYFSNGFTDITGFKGHVEQNYLAIRLGIHF